MHAHTQLSIISLFVCTYNARMHTQIVVDPRTMRQDFEGGIYWDELAEICGEISRAAGFRGAARFQGNTVYMYTVGKIQRLQNRKMCSV